MFHKSDIKGFQGESYIKDFLGSCLLPHRLQHCLHLLSLPERKISQSKFKDRIKSALLNNYVVHHLSHESLQLKEAHKIHSKQLPSYVGCMKTCCN